VRSYPPAARSRWRPWASACRPRLRALGFTVYDPDMTMFTQSGGGVHCMAQPLRRDPA
jgi:N-dimethylarginine dimethylaminohydrolase